MSLPTPNTRKEQYLNAIATGNASGLPTPITREEEYLDAIAKGGGSGEGDMKKSVYDSDLDVAGVGGIKAFVNSAVAGKVDKVEGKGLSTNDYTDEDKAIVDSVTGALEEKADTDDIPALVNANFAKGVKGNETVQSTDKVPFISKQMGSGAYQRKKFVGGSVVWNQLITNGNFANTSDWISVTANFSVSNNKALFTATAQNGRIFQSISCIANHKYFFTCKHSENVAIRFYGYSTSLYTNRSFMIFNAETSYVQMWFYDPRSSGWSEESVENVQLFDLTQLFG